MKEITHPLLGKLVPAQAPIATQFGEEDDWDLALYVDGPAWLVKLELDYKSYVTYRTETIEKEFALDVEHMEYGRGYFVSKFEELYDKVAQAQLAPFIPHHKIVEIRRAIMGLIDEAFMRLDSGLHE
jgi:hypothetical protein